MNTTAGSNGLAVGTSALSFMGIGRGALTPPMFKASNAIFPLDLMPGWLRILAQINHLTYPVDALRGLMIVGGESVHSHGMDLGSIAHAAVLSEMHWGPRQEILDSPHVRQAAFLSATRGSGPRRRPGLLWRARRRRFPWRRGFQLNAHHVSQFLRAMPRAQPSQKLMSDCVHRRRYGAGPS